MRIVKVFMCLGICLFTLNAAFAFSDVEDYKLHVEEVKKEVWGWNKPEFKTYKVPSEFDRFSYVTLAKHVEISASMNKKFHFVALANWTKKEYLYTSTIREMIKLNDKAALDEYSEISYQQFRQKNFYTATGTSTTIIGVRVIKPNGIVKEVSTDETVLTKDSKRDKQAKLAISDLQVGDIIDYFICTEDKMEDGKAPEESFFVFGDENPILNYSVHCVLGKKYAIEYRAMNGAPEFKQSQGEDEDIVLDVGKADIPAFPTTLWMSAMRQLPILRLNIIVGYKGMYAKSRNSRRPGEVYRNQSADEIMEDQEIEIESLKAYVKPGSKTNLYFDVKSALLKIDKDFEKLPKAELALRVFYVCRYLYTMNVSASSPIKVDFARNYGTMDTKMYLFTLSEVMRDFGINAGVALVSSKYGPRINQVMKKNDYNFLVVINEEKTLYMGIESLFSPANFIPYQYEGVENSTVINSGPPISASRRLFNKSVVSLPTSSWMQNVQSERLNVSFNPVDLQVVKIERQTSNTGHFCADAQKDLMPFEQYFEAERHQMGIEKSLIEEFSESKRTKTLSDEYRSAFGKAREEQRRRFLIEVERQFGMKPKELFSFKIDTLGMRHTEPAFVYSTHFSMEGLVKKAGANYIMDIGKLISSQIQLKAWQRERKVDVYMPFARTFEYVISVAIPEGYKAEGIEKLSQKVETDAASFLVTTSAVNNQVNVSVKKIYKHSFEAVSNWPMIVEVLDAAVNFNSSKLLIRKI